MSEPLQSRLYFSLLSADPPHVVMSRLQPRGSPALNRTHWRDKLPRTCAVVSARTGPLTVGSGGPVRYEVIVLHRPQKCVSYTGRTRYEGWTAMVPNRAPDGTLLDASGHPLPAGHPPVLLPVEVYEDLEFNDLDLGDFVREEVVAPIQHRDHDEVWNLLTHGPGMSVSMSSDFVAPRRNRPSVKVVISPDPTGVWADKWGTRIVNVCSETVHLREKVLDEIVDVVFGFVEGRFTIKNVSSDGLVFVDLSDVLVDCSGVRNGEPSRFDCLSEYLSDDDREDLARRLMANYKIMCSVVDGSNGGLLISRLGHPS